MKSELKKLQQRIDALEEENKILKKEANIFLTTANTVSVPAQFKPVFDEAEKTVKSYFTKFKASPSEGNITINDERYVLLRASSLSNGFFNKLKDLYADKGEHEAYRIGKNFLFDIAHVLGLEDAKNFHLKMDLKDPISKLSAGPIHFAYTGWAYVDILPESTPSPDENCYLKYHHPYSFEADSWMKAGVKSEFPVCIMNAGYSSGWCEESFGIPLTAVEISCKAKGDDNCTFIMAPPHKINDYLKQNDEVNKTSTIYDVPLFFERQKAEEKIKSSLREKEILLKEVHHRVKNNLQIISSLLNLQSHHIKDKGAVDLFQETKNRIKTIALVHEKLYNSNDVEYVNINQYVESMVELLSYSYNKEYIEVTIDIKGVGFEKFDMEKAIPCGLIMNEIISNSYKHAFINKLKGKMDISFYIENETVIINIADNGPGIPPQLDLKNLNSLGLELIDSLVNQLDGTYEISSLKGTSYLIKFPC